MAQLQPRQGRVSDDQAVDQLQDRLARVVDAMRQPPQVAQADPQLVTLHLQAIQEVSTLLAEARLIRDEARGAAQTTLSEAKNAALTLVRHTEETARARAAATVAEAQHKAAELVREAEETARARAAATVTEAQQKASALVREAEESARRGHSVRTAAEAPEPTSAVAQQRDETPVLAAPPSPAAKPAHEPAEVGHTTWWRLAPDGTLAAPTQLPDLALAEVTHRATLALGALLAARLRVARYVRDLAAKTLAVTIRDQDTQQTWLIEASWQGEGAAVAVLAAIAATFEEPVPVLGLRHLRRIGRIRGGAADLPGPGLVVVDDGPAVGWQRLLATVPAGTSVDLDAGESCYLAARVGAIAVGCEVSSEDEARAVGAWLDEVTAVAAADG